MSANEKTTTTNQAIRFKTEVLQKNRLHPPRFSASGPILCPNARWCQADPVFWGRKEKERCRGRMSLRRYRARHLLPSQRVCSFFANFHVSCTVFGDILGLANRASAFIRYRSFAGCSGGKVQRWFPEHRRFYFTAGVYGSNHSPVSTRGTDIHTATANSEPCARRGVFGDHARGPLYAAA